MPVPPKRTPDIRWSISWALPRQLGWHIRCRRERQPRAYRSEV